MELINKKMSASRYSLLTTHADLYCVISTLLLLGSLITANLTISFIPQRHVKLDVTASKIFSLSDQSKQVVESLNETVTLFWVTNNGEEDPAIETLLARYGDLSSYIEIRRINLETNPGFANKYTPSILSKNSVIAEMVNRYKVVDYSSIYTYDLSKYYETGEYDLYFDGESAITGAINHVANGHTPKLFFLMGHGEPTSTSFIAEKLQKDNVETVFYNLMGGSSVPHDADILFIYNPRSDFSKLEVEMLIEYMGRGGRIIAVTDLVRNDLPNLRYFAKYYALQTVEGLVMERDQGRFAWGRPYYLFPIMKSHAVTNALKNRGYSILMPGAFGFKQDLEARNSLIVTPLLVTSENSHAFLEGHNSSSAVIQGANTQGPFMLGVLVKERYSSVQGEIIWYTSADMLVQDYDEMISGANLNLFCNSVAFLTGNNTNISIRSKGIMPDYLKVNSLAGNFISIFLIGAIPALYMLPGVIISFHRRRMK